MIVDVVVSVERGKYMGIVGVGINIGFVLSLVFGGFFVEYFGWLVIFWFCMIYVVVWFVLYVLMVFEICRNVVGNGLILV